MLDTIAGMFVLDWNARRTRDFGTALARWYERSGRDLPWRRDLDPYRVWVSEIMLQQTRVAVVIPYFERFMRRFPTVQHLARAKETSVLAAWSGLGYYRRARMMHAASRVIARDLRGEFPKTEEGWRELPGIGPYTAAAIASIALGAPVATVDGNIERVLARISGRELTKAQVWSAAQQLIRIDAPGDHNQAMMELGATVCGPGAPRCSECPVIEYCATRGVSPRKASAARRQVEIAFGLARRNGSVFLVERAASETLMAGMWELPQVRRYPKREPLMTVRHAITSTDYRVAIHHLVATPRDGRWVSLKTINRLPLTGLTRKVLRHVGALI